MPESTAAEAFLNACTVEVDVFALRPDYRALLLVADGLAPAAWGEGDDVVDGLIAGAEAHARDLLAESPAEELPGIASWRDAYRAFARSHSGHATASRRSPDAPSTGCPE